MNEELKKQLKKIEQEYPLVPHTHAGRLYSMVRRMNKEKELNIPIGFRSGFAISVKTGKSTNKMTESEWNDFYKSLSKELSDGYPDLFERIFSK
jgi:hypothetical protein